jgi:hypothetical protein
MLFRAYTHLPRCLHADGNCLEETNFLLLYSGHVRRPGKAVHEKEDPQAGKLVVLEHLWNDAQVNRDQRALEGMIAGSYVDTEWDARSASAASS